MLEPEKYEVIEIDEHPDIFVEDTDNNNIVTKSTFLEGCRNFTALRIQKRLIYKVSTLYRLVVSEYELPKFFVYKSGALRAKCLY